MCEYECDIGEPWTTEPQICISLLLLTVHSDLVARTAASSAAVQLMHNFFLCILTECTGDSETFWTISLLISLLLLTDKLKFGGQNSSQQHCSDICCVDARDLC